MSRRNTARKRPKISQRNTVDRSPKPEKDKAQKAAPQKEEVDNMRRGILLAIGGATLVTGFFGVRSLLSEEDNDDTEKNNNSVEKCASGIRLSEDGSIDIPSYSTDTTENIPYEKPSSLPIDDAEFIELSKRFSAEIKEMALDFNEKVKGDQRLYLTSLNDFLQKVQNVVMYGDQRITDNFKELSASIRGLDKKERFPLIMERINQYLLPTGMYIFFDLNTQNKIPRLNIYSVTQAGHVSITDKEKKEKVPYLKLDNPLLQKHRFQLGGTVDPTKKRVVIFQDEMPSIERDFMAAAGEPMNDSNRREFRENSLRHEATHLFIVRRFPDTSKDMERQFSHDVTYDINGDKNTHTMNVHVYSAHEVCGLGAQLMNTKSKTDLLAYLNMKGSQQYALAQSIIIMAVLQISGSSAENCDIADALKGGNEADLAKAKEIANSSQFSVKDVQRVGEILYRFGYGFFRDKENK